MENNNSIIILFFEYRIIYTIIIYYFCHSFVISWEKFNGFSIIQINSSKPIPFNYSDI